MALDSRRIASAIDLVKLGRARAVVVGCGGSANLITSLFRSGIREFVLIDPDVVSPENLVRQEFSGRDVGSPKVEAVRRHLEAIDPGCTVLALQEDVTRLSAPRKTEVFGNARLVIATTDSFAAQAEVNTLALEYRVPALWPGIYEGGLGGEVIFWREGLPCYRCLVPGRYRAQEAARARGERLDPPSDGTTIFDDGYIDCIAGMLALGLLTRGSDDRFGTLIDDLGDRNLVHVKIDRNHSWNGRDITREQLRVPDDADTYFGWTAAVRRDPDRGQLFCPDCDRFGHVPGHGFATRTNALA